MRSRRYRRDAILPARELLGDMLLDSGQPAGALAAYEASLVNDPKRLRSFDGAALAALAAGNPTRRAIITGAWLRWQIAAATGPNLAPHARLSPASSRIGVAPGERLSEATA